eukprot:4230868-Alexandrium_andersonii.AAC.1
MRATLVARSVLSTSTLLSGGGGVGHRAPMAPLASERTRCRAAERERTRDQSRPVGEGQARPPTASSAAHACPHPRFSGSGGTTSTAPLPGEAADATPWQLRGAFPTTPE